MVRDPEGVIQFWNSGAEELYGWPREEVVGKRVDEVITAKPHNSNGTLQPDLIDFGRWEGNLVHATRDGREIVVASRQALKTNGDGSGAILEINRDITATLQTEEALRRAERLAAMGRVAGIIAHEINNPLEAIINAFYLLRDHPSLDEDARRFARLGEEELLRVAHIVRQTLGFYRESQHPVAISVPEILDNVLELQARHFQLNRIEVEKLYETDATLFVAKDSILPLRLGWRYLLPAPFDVKRLPGNHYTMFHHHHVALAQALAERYDRHNVT